MTKPTSSELGAWLRVLVFPVVAGVGGWFSAEITVSAHSCLTGEGGEGVAHADFLVLGLILAGPIAIAWRERHSRPVARRVAAPAVACLFLSVVLVFMGAQLWWYHHNCYT